ncbi:MAG: hypothetical protein H0X37_08265 [Herpetosiphonaceae bacterium]|nr:hypothetical protein [Herpetosiphonaceae bacterium]
MAVAGAGLIGYGGLFLIRNFTSLLEIGIGPAQVGVTAARLQATFPGVYHYLSHVQVALSGFIMGLGLALIVLGLGGVRRGYGWAFWGAVGSAVLAVGVALPMHYPYGLDTLGHLGPIYADVGIFMIGAACGLPSFLPKRR